jgi:hypothetical protein
MSPVRRRPKAQEPARPYWWWKGESVEELTRRLNAAGPGARFEVHIDAQQHATMIVLPPDAEEVTAQSFGPPINDSFICPPRC